MRQPEEERRRGPVEGRRVRRVRELTPFELRRYLGDGASLGEITAAAEAFDGGWALEERDRGGWVMSAFSFRLEAVASWLHGDGAFVP